MSVKQNFAWLLLLVRLPATHSAERVAIWRKLKKSGAIQIQTSTYVLPDHPPRYETFQWLTQHIRDAGGDATLVRAREIEGLSNENLIELFNAARAKEYAALAELLRATKPKGKKQFSNLIERGRKQFRKIRQTDFFSHPRAQDVEMLLRKLEGRSGTETSSPRLSARDYRRKTWVPRWRPEFVRGVWAWLIRKFIDAKARFAFGPKPPSNRSAVLFDMLDADFS